MTWQHHSFLRDEHVPEMCAECPFPKDAGIHLPGPPPGADAVIDHDIQHGRFAFRERAMVLVPLLEARIAGARRAAAHAESVIPGAVIDVEKELLPLVSAVALLREIGAGR